jgi:Arc/MetJ-type ribon-helix-helix transcriptional regulator
VTNVITIKLTDAELDLLDWMIVHGEFVSRSGVLRESTIDQARAAGAPGELLRRVNLARLTSQPRASKTVARRRRAGASPPRPAEVDT